MNRYYCVKCNATSIIYSSQPEQPAVCSCSKEQTTHRLLSLKGKPTPQVTKNVVPEVEPVPIVPAPKPQTKLDVASGPIKPATK